MIKGFARIGSAFVFLTAVATHIAWHDTQNAIYFLLMALYLIHVSETL